MRRTAEVGAWGEDYASGELELRGWIVSIPTRDVGIDRVAFKVDIEKFKYLFVQVKTVVWSARATAIFCNLQQVLIAMKYSQVKLRGLLK